MASKQYAASSEFTAGLSCGAKCRKLGGLEPLEAHVPATLRIVGSAREMIGGETGGATGGATGDATGEATGGSTDGAMGGSTGGAMG